MGYLYSRYSYNRLRNQRQQYLQDVAQPGELTDPEVQKRIQNIRTKDGLSDWEKNFLESIETYFAHKNGLTAGQYSAFKKIENKYSDTAIAERDEFEKSFTDEMRSNMKIVASIYKNKSSPYYRDFYNKILADDKFIPTKAQWDKFMNNKYAEGYLKNVKGTPKFKVGDTVCPSSHDKSERYKTAIIIDNEGVLPDTHGEGGKKYTILPYGQTNTLIIEERQLKFQR